MGIKGLFGEIESGEDAPLAKLALEYYLQHNRPLRVAIDVSIWAFQSQTFTAKNKNDIGHNSALKVLYYRLLRLIELHIQPLFVFDGPGGPTFKRDKNVGKTREHPIYWKIRELLPLFGFPFHRAPGEAEAECAHLQKIGVVDAVLSEDADTLMFGCGLTLRASKDKGKVQMVTVYDLDKIRERDKLTTAGMILIALLSSGDYNTAGIKNCGIAIASAAARGNYGESLIRASLSKRREESLALWREQLLDSIKTNSEGLFKRRTNNVDIPASFPDLEILMFYVKPLVTPEPDIPEFLWDVSPNVPLIRAFAGKNFDWDLSGKFIRTSCLAIINHQLRTGIEYNNSIIEVHGRRQHVSTGNAVEVRCSVIPLDVVRIPYDHEKEMEAIDQGNDQDGEAEDAEEAEDEAPPNSQVPPPSPTKKRHRKRYNPREAERIWIPEMILQCSAKGKIEAYDEAIAAKAAAKQQLEADRAAAKLLKASSKKTKTKAIPNPNERQITDFFAVGKRATPPNYFAKLGKMKGSLGLSNEEQNLRCLQACKGDLAKAVSMVLDENGFSQQPEEPVRPSFSPPEPQTHRQAPQRITTDKPAVRSSPSPPKVHSTKVVTPKPTELDFVPETTHEMEDSDSSSDIEIVSVTTMPVIPPPPASSISRPSLRGATKSSFATQPANIGGKPPSSAQLPPKPSFASQPQTTKVATFSRLQTTTSSSQFHSHSQSKIAYTSSKVQSSRFKQQLSNESEKATGVLSSTPHSSGDDGRIYRKGRVRLRESAPGQYAWEEDEDVKVEVMDLLDG